MFKILLLTVLCFFMAPGHTAVVKDTKPYMPPLALQYMPILKDEIKTHWPDLPFPSMLAAQVEQESCISLKHSRCWNTRAELKTDREYGFGLGQITITKKFNVFEEVKASDKSLRDWKWEDRFDPRYQLRAIVIKMRNGFRTVSKSFKGFWDQMAAALAGYNGGLGSVLKDRTLCVKTPGCDPSYWFGNVENNSYKSRVAVKGYGKSFFEINREYPKLVMFEKPRRAKYIPYMDKT